MTLDTTIKAKHPDANLVRADLCATIGDALVSLYPEPVISEGYTETSVITTSKRVIPAGINHLIVEVHLSTTLPSYDTMVVCLVFVVSA